jgi:hypothetical protein
MNTTHKIYLGVLSIIAAAVLCTLPFLLVNKETIYVYTQNQHPNTKERGFVDELKNSGYRVILNKPVSQNEKVAIWFKPTSMVRDIITSSLFEYNFIYNEDYYPYNWQGLVKHPIMLTPYQDLYEHYMRSNIKSALFYLGVNLKDYYPRSNNKYNLAYYEQRSSSTETGSYLSNLADVKYIGRFWQNDIKYNASSEEIAQKENEMLSEAYAVVVDNTFDNKLIPEEILQATASGSLVLTPKNNAIYNIFKDNIVYYEQKEDIQILADYYKKHVSLSSNKTNKAREITVKKLSSKASVDRFIKLLEWMTIASN